MRTVLARGVAAAVLAAAAIAAVPGIAAAGGGGVAPQTVYGRDDRREVSELTGARAAVADSVVALVSTFDLDDNGDGTSHLYSGLTLQEYEGLCPGERFARQPVVAFCSGSLVAPDVVLTAGHCVTDRSDLRYTRFVFGFRMLDGGRARVDVPNGEIYKGAQILSRREVDDGADYALVRLSRPVVGHEPLAVRRGAPAVGAPIYVVGHPTGLPAKFAAGAKVHALHRDFFSANLDVFGGNSGSPVLDARTNAIVGVLVRGNPDYVTRGRCAVPLILPDSYAAEESTSSSAFAAFVPKR